MKYDLQINVPPKKPVIPFSLRLDEETVREFKYVTNKVLRISMTKVLTDMLQEFVQEHRSKMQGTQKQREMF